MGLPTRCRRHRIRIAFATARLASACMSLSQHTSPQSCQLRGISSACPCASPVSLWVYLSHDELVESFHNLHRGQIGQVYILLQEVRWLCEASC